MHPKHACEGLQRLQVAFHRAVFWAHYCL